MRGARQHTTGDTVTDHGDALLALAVDIAQEAGALLRSYAGRSDLDVESKSSATDPVSAADRASEQLISRRIASARPDDGMVGEEQAGDRTGTTGVRWVVDPLDGTVNYLYGLPQWSVSIGVEDDGGGLAGVVYDPSRDETFAALRGAGATLDGSPLRMIPPESLASAMIASGFGYDPDVRREQAAMIVEIIDIVRDVRRLGSAALDLSWVAAGRYDGYYEFCLNHWDRSAGGLVVAEAGGTLSRWRMALAGTDWDGVVAGTRVVHDPLVEWLMRHGARPVTDDQGG